MRVTEKLNKPFDILDYFDFSTECEWNHIIDQKIVFCAISQVGSLPSGSVGHNLVWINYFFVLNNGWSSFEEISESLFESWNA